MKKLRIKEDDGTLTCLCGNTGAQEGWEEDHSQAFMGVYLAVCRRCGIKFDDDTLEIVGMRFVSGYQSQLVERYLGQIMGQSRAYFKKKNKRFITP